MWSLPMHLNYYEKKIFFFSFYKKEEMSSLSTKETKAKFNKLSNDLNIKLVTGSRNFIFYINSYIYKRENLRKRPIDLGIKNKQIAFCPNLLFGILSFSLIKIIFQKVN